MNALDGTDAADASDASDADFLDLANRVRDESGNSSTCDDLLRTGDAQKLAAVLVAPGQPLWAREIAAFRLGCARDTRAFEALVLLLNHRDPERCVAASHALALLGDPRTPRAAAALATNPLRTAYALHPVRLLTRLRAPESVPALITTLDGLLTPGEPHWRVALACVEGLGALGDRRAVPVLRAALGHPRLSAAAGRALSSLA
ncbi:HEAT repeat domain-containing protein [Streptomyces montanisoli]|uniref:HEAT repeat domain-containing protein n=1 Tax=Streptomyces montanisoli TaxID=2798581 RepID=A0A940RY01_9ACTN|nr:HEAT repeat domain-containing protein [Streptomyces montanisoli]MBP0458139.1 HEAT repeat domain-containing protein [Streptomyces montanisoli]